MQREQIIARLQSANAPFDVLIIGGGATGFACAVDALSRGYSVALIERGDFGEGTSSRSTKLIHGGVRYLRQGNIHLVRESLRERSWFFRAASHLVHPLEFIIPCRSRISQWYYRAGMGVYDAMAHPPPHEHARVLSREEVVARSPGCATQFLAGGVRYMDGQFDDARMIICFLRHVIETGGFPLNYAAAVELIKERGRVVGVMVEDRETGRVFPVKARAVINATGVAVDAVCRMDGQLENKVTSSQGIHLVLDQSFLGGTSALMIPGTSDGRVLFAIPWHGRVLFGTTDTPWPDSSREPKPMEEEIEYLLNHGAKVFRQAPVRTDVKGMFAGLRPLPKPHGNKKTSAISRDFRIDVSGSRLVSVYGGKWTTCRAMGQAGVDQAVRAGGLPVRTSQSQQIIFTTGMEPESHLQPPNRLWVLHAVRNEMARNLDDLLLRRVRLGVLDHETAMETAPDCARWMAEALMKNQAWIQEQCAAWGKTSGA